MRRSTPRQMVMLMAMLLLFSFHVFSQNRVTGTVTDATGKGVARVTVTVKGTSTATTTDEDGSFSITAPGNATLVISAVGFRYTGDRCSKPLLCIGADGYPRVQYERSGGYRLWYRP
jgi:hypothetical protein